jgi:tetratricopeptide (TPR) repeat protein
MTDWSARRNTAWDEVWRGSYAEAEKLFKASIKEIERSEPRSSWLPLILGDLASVCLSQEKHSETEALYVQALTVADKIFGPNAPSLLLYLEQLYKFQTETRGIEYPDPMLLHREVEMREKVTKQKNWQRARSLYERANSLPDEACGEAETLLQEAIALWEECGVPEHMYFAFSLEGLASLYLEQGRYLESEPLLRKALIMEWRMSGRGHGARRVVRDLSEVCLVQGRSIEAESFLRCLVAVADKGDSQDSDIPFFHQRLALACQANGKYADAEAYFRRVLAVQEAGGLYAIQVEDDLVPTLRGLALVCHAQGKHTEAEALLRHAAEIRNEDGSSYLVLATPYDDLAMLYRDLGKHDKSQVLTRRAMALRKAHLGGSSFNPRQDLRVPLDSREILSSYPSDHAAAERCLERILNIRESALGSQHPMVAETLRQLASAAHTLGKNDEAVRYLRRVLAICEITAGPESISVAEALEDLVERDYVNKGPLLRRTLAIYEKILGPNDPAVAKCLICLGSTYHHNSSHDEGFSHLTRALEIYERILGPKDPVLINFMCDLAYLYSNNSDAHSAERLYELAISRAEEGLGPESIELSLCVRGFAEHYRCSREYDKSEKLLLRALAILEKIAAQSYTEEERDSGLPNEDQRSLAAVLDELERVYRAWGKPRKADSVKARVEAIRRVLR